MEQDDDTPLAARPGFARLGLHRAEPPPRLGDLSALLAEIDSLRTTLQTDLSLAAAALDEDAAPLAQELLEGDLGALQGFEERAVEHLDAMARAEVSAQRSEEATLATSSSAAALHRGRRRRRRRLIPTGPLLVAAAALLGFAAGAVPERVVPPPPVVTSSGAAEASYELSRLVLEGAPSDELRQAAEVLHDGVVEMIATSEGNPATAAEAMMLLQYSNEVLILASDQGSLQGVLAQGRELTEHLRGLTPTAPGVIPVLTGRPPALPPQPLRRIESSGTATSPGSLSPLPAPLQSSTSSLPDPQTAAPRIPTPGGSGDNASGDGTLGHVR